MLHKTKTRLSFTPRGNKPLPESTLTKVHEAMWRHWPRRVKYLEIFSDNYFVLHSKYHVMVCVTATGQVTVIWMSQYAVCRLTASLLVISGSYLYRRVMVLRIDTARVSCALLVKSPCSGAADHSLAPCLSEWTRRNSWGWYRTWSALFDWVCIIVCSYME